MKATPITFAMVSAATVLSATVYSAQDTRPVQPFAEPTWESCEEMHDGYVRRFESLAGFGLSRMAQPPMLDRAGLLDLGRARYSIESIELVGLLNRESPVVYVPVMHSLGPDTGFKSRDLTTFETESVTAFRADKNLASAGEDADTMQCVGSLRAKASCLRCHQSSKAGDLLGAFTYKLHRLRQH